MPSLGELFVELGVVGDVKPLEKAIKTMKEAVKQIDDEIKANQRLLKYLQDIKNARNASEKALIKENFANEIKKQKMLDEIDANQKAVDGKKALASNIAGVVKGVGVFVGALTGAAVALNKFTNDLVEANQSILNLTRTTDIAQGTFQKWGNIGKMLGVENAAQQLEDLNQQLFNLMLTGEGARGYQLAGINPMGQDANGVLEQLRSRVSGMNDTTATYLLQQMGLDPRMLHLLRLSRDEFESLGQTIKRYQLTPEQTKQIQAMNIQFQIAGIKLQYLRDRAILAIMPAWVKFMASIARVAEGLAKVTKWVTSADSEGAKFTKTLLGIASAIGVIKLALWALTAHPIIAGITALIGALYLLADDVMGYFQGKDSLIGTIINGLEDLDIKGYIDFPVPKWLEYMIKVIDFFNGKTKPPEEQITKYAEQLNGLPPELAALKQMDIFDPSRPSLLTTLKYLGQNADKKIVPVLSTPNTSLLTPAIQRNYENHTSTADNRQINQNIQIQTSQPVSDIQNQLTNARYTFGMNGSWG